MLQNIRRWSETWVARIFLAIMMLAFAAFFGLTDFTGGVGGHQHTDVVAEVGERNITGSMLSRALDEQLRGFSERLGGQPITPQMARRIGLVDGRIEDLIAERLLLNESDRLGLAVGDAQVQEQIQNTPEFLGLTQGFDVERYRAFAASEGFSQQEYFEEVRTRMASGLLLTALTGMVRLPEATARAIAASEAAERSGQAIILQPNTFPAPPVDEAAERVYYQENIARFQSPEQREIRYVRMDPQELAASLSPPDDILRQAFEDRRDEFAVPGQRSATQFVGTRAEAEQIHQLVAGGMAFEAAVAQQVAEAAPVSLPLAPRERYLSGLREAVFGPDAPGLVEPVQSAVGWHVVRIDQIEESVAPDFEQAREVLRQEYAALEAETAIRDLSDALIDELAGGQSLENTARKLGLELVSPGPLGREGVQEGSGVEPRRASDIANLLPVMFSLGEGEESDLIETGDGRLLLMRLDRILPARPLPFEENREQIREERIRDARTRLLQDQMADLVSDLEDPGVNPSQRAIDLQLALVAVPRTNIRGLGTVDGENPAPPLIRDLQEALFPPPDAEAATPPAAGRRWVRQVTLSDGSVAALVIVNHREQDAPDPARIDAIRGELEPAVAADLLRAYTTALRAQTEIEINQQALDYLFPAEGTGTAYGATYGTTH